MDTHFEIYAGSDTEFDEDKLLSITKDAATQTTIPHKDPAPHSYSTYSPNWKRTQQPSQTLPSSAIKQRTYTPEPVALMTIKLPFFGTGYTRNTATY